MVSAAGQAHDPAGRRAAAAAATRRTSSMCNGAGNRGGKFLSSPQNALSNLAPYRGTLPVTLPDFAWLPKSPWQRQSAVHSSPFTFAVGENALRTDINVG
jgi:hypothetical protein